MAIVKGPHVLVVPFPAQGHVTPLMKLSCLLASRGIKVTFAVTQNVHDKIVVSDDYQDSIVVTSIPDGLAPQDDHNDVVRLWESLKRSLAGSLADLIEKINCDDEKISCVIADTTVGWILEIAQEMGVEPVVITPAGAASLGMVLQIPTLIQQGNLDLEGTVMGCHMFRLSDGIPPWKKNELIWSFPIDLQMQKNLFECCLSAERIAAKAKLVLCNTFYELESSACDLNPKLLPLGPLLNSKDSGNSFSFHPEDTSCLSWLNEKPASSVIYVSFGSLAVFSQYQLDELALGLELSGRPFLWVVRSDLANGSRVEYPDGFLERVVAGGFGKIVEWAPQEKVLCHPSVACFLSHCGWNSTVEGLSRGLPFLCWPYFADQHHNQNYICEQWKIGLRIEIDENGIRSRHEIKAKIDQLLSDENLKANALKLKAIAEKSVERGGSSCMNLEKFVEYLKK